MTERPARPLSLKELAELKEKPDRLDAMSYTVGADGDLMRREETNELRFGFTLKDHAFAGKVRRSGERASLSICGEIGHLPFSAQNSFARHSIKRVIEATDLLRHARFQVQPDQKLLLFGEVDTPLKMTQGDIIAAICKILLDAKPHLDLIDEIMNWAMPPGGIKPPLLATGTAEGESAETAGPDAEEAAEEAAPEEAPEEAPAKTPEAKKTKKKTRKSKPRPTKKAPSSKVRGKPRPGSKADLAGGTGEAPRREPSGGKPRK